MITKEDLEKDYIDAREAKTILRLSGSRMSRLCTGGRFPGAFKFGSIWIIPREAVKNHTKLKPGAKKGKRRTKTVSEVPAAPPKRRGRPPKVRTEATEGTPRRRGRPPKTQPETAAAAINHETTLSPRKRGRPRGSKNKKVKG